MVDISIEVKCDCGETLETELHKTDRYGVILLAQPCDSCAEKNRKAGYEEGKE